jgi:heat shock protein HtpX
MSTNTLKTALLLGLLTAVLLIGGQAVGGRNGLYIALFFAIAMNFSGYFFSERIALAMYSAQPVTETENTDVYRRVAPIVQNLCQRMNLPMPRLWLIEQESPNAFATGRNPSHASVAFTSGILQLMSDSEIEGVVAHRTGARAASRYSDQLGGGDDRRHDYVASEHGAVGHDFRRRLAERRR